MVEATARLNVEVPEPGAAIDAGLKLAVTPVGAPLAVNAIAELKPPETAVVMVELPLLPCATETEVGEEEIVKAGTGAEVTTNETDAVCVMLSPVPVIVIGYVPGVVVEATTKDTVEVPEPGVAMDVGLKLTVTPVG